MHGVEAGGGSVGDNPGDAETLGGHLTGDEEHGDHRERAVLAGSDEVVECLPGAGEDDAAERSFGTEFAVRNAKRGGAVDGDGRVGTKWGEAGASGLDERAVRLRSSEHDPMSALDEFPGDGERRVHVSARSHTAKEDLTHAVGPGAK